MKLLDAEWKGFASYADVAKVTFSEGLTGIVGTYAEDERKSMGAGKSTIVMTLLYALFNKGSFKSISEVINDSYTDKDHVYVKYRFIKYGNIYTVERGILNGSAYLDLYENNDPIGENKIPSRNEEILKIVGWDYDMFTASIFFEQDKLSKLVDTDGAKRREYIEKILNTRDWTLLQEGPKKRLSKLNEELLIKQKLLTSTQKSLQECEEMFNQYLDLDDQLIEKENNKKIIEQKIKEYNEQIQQVKENNIILNHKKDLYKSHISTLSSIEKSINKLTLSIDNISSSVQTNEKNIEEDNILLNKLQKDIIELTSNKETLTNTNQELIDKKNSLDKDIAVINSTIYQISKAKEAYLKDQAICDNCEQHITKEYAQEKIKEKSNLLDEQINNKKEKETNCLILSNEININSENLKILTDNISKVEKEITRLETQITNYNNASKNYQLEYDRDNKQLNSYNKELNTSNDLLTNFLQELKDAYKIDIKDENDFDILITNICQGINIPEIDKEINLLTTSLENVSSEINIIFTKKGKKEELSNNITNYKQLSANISKEIETILNDIQIEDKILKGFKEIPSSLLASNIKKIEKYANEYIKKFIPYMEVCVQEDLEKSNKPIEIFYKFKGKERSYRMLSGGQKTISNLGLRLAFSKIISEKTNSISEVLILDEPFGYLDEYSRDLIKNVLSDLQKQYKQIIVISHIDNVTTFPNIINVRMENNKSFIIDK